MILDRYGMPTPETPSLGTMAEQWAQGTTLTQGSIFTKLLPFHQEGAQLPNPLDFNGLVTRFYRKNAIVYSAVRLLSGSASDPDFQAGSIDDNNVFMPSSPNDPLQSLIRNPNEAQDRFEFLEQLIIHLYTTGNAFVHLIRSGAGIPVQMELIRPDVMSMVPVKAPTGKRIINFFAESNGEKIKIPANDIIQFRLPDALDEFWGLSPLFVLSRLGDIDDQSVDFLRAYFLNKGVPSGMLSVAGRIQDNDRDAMKLKWQQQFQGKEGWHKIPVMDQGVKFEPLSTGLRDMDLNPIFNQTETRIAMVFGVPPILLGTNAGLERSTFSNFKESRRGFWQETLSPMYTRLERRFTRMLAQKEFGMDRAIQFDLSKVAGLQASQDELRSFSLEGWRRGLLTRDDALKLVDMDPSTHNGDSVLLGTSQVYVPLSQATQFADLTGDVVSDLVQEEIVESQDPTKTAGVGDPSPPLRGKDDPSKNPREDVTIVQRSWNPETGDCTAHEVFACKECQAAKEAAELSPTSAELLDHIAVVQAAMSGDQDAQDLMLDFFPGNVAGAILNLIDRAMSEIKTIENAVTLFTLAIGEDIDVIQSWFEVVVALELDGRSVDEIQTALQNAKALARKEDNDLH